MSRVLRSATRAAYALRNVCEIWWRNDRGDFDLRGRPRIQDVSQIAWPSRHRDCVLFIYFPFSVHYSASRLYIRLALETDCIACERFTTATTAAQSRTMIGLGHFDR